MEGKESHNQESILDIEMRMVTQEGIFQNTIDYSEDIKPEKLQKKQKIQEQDTLNNYGQVTREEQDQEMMENSSLPVQKGRKETTEQANLADTQKKAWHQKSWIKIGP